MMQHAATLPARDPTPPEPSPPTEEPALVRKLARHVSLPQVERAALTQILAANVRSLQARTTLIEEGMPPVEISVMLEGWACRHSRAGKGRQIVAFYVPGDVCDFDSFLLARSDQAIAAVGRVRVAGIGRSTLNVLSKRCPQASRGLLWESATAAAIQRRWTINVAQRSARQRIAHLLCELWVRLDAVGLIDSDGCDFPLSQPDIADACGLTPEHTNRTLQEFRAEELLALQDQRLRLADFDALAAIGEFDRTYLQLEPPVIDAASRTTAAPMMAHR